MSASAEEITSLIDMTKALRGIDDEAWGAYAFSADPLHNRIPEEKQRGMIRQAIRCGEDCADRVVMETGESSPAGIARRFGLTIIENNLPMIGRRKVFAQFTPPAKIELFTEPAERYAKVLAGANDQQAAQLISIQEINSLVLGHEIYHYIEECSKDTIYSRTEKITLWHVFGFHYDTGVNALGEIAGMAFSRRLSQVAYSPFLLDVLLFFDYNYEQTTAIFQNIMKMSGTNSETGCDV
jgi:hypothetical protein